MNSKQARYAIRVQSPYSPSYPIRPRTGSRRRPVAAERRWAIGLSAPDWGFRIAYNHFISGEPLPATIQDEAVRRAYFFLRGADDEMVSVTLSLRQPEMEWTRMTLQGPLCARDVSVDGIANLLELPRTVVELFAALFFPVW
jgi:hypothetical protein